MQGYRLHKGEYVAIKPVNGRLPSRVVGLHLERAGSDLRLWHPETGLWLPTPQANEARLQETLEENERLRREIEQLRRHSREP
jgi:hypothetical protein